jgi:hypothetical protein
MVGQSRRATRSQSQAQDTRRTPRDGTPTDARRDTDNESLSDAPPDIEEQIERERAESQRLRTQIQEVRRRKREAVDARIAELEREEAQRAYYEAELEELLKDVGDRTAAPHKRTGSDGAIQGRRVRPRRESMDFEEEPRTRPPRTAHEAPKFRDLPTYNGKTLREAQTFLNGADRRFRMDGGTRYPDDQSRIDYCVLAFGPGPAAKWERHEQRAGLGNTTWAQFREWMMDSIIDPSNRAFDAITSYNNARQRDGQLAEDFAAYLDTLELELRIDDDVLRRNTLYAKLREDIQREILSRNDVPLTRQGLLSLATRIETTHRITNRERGRRSVGRAPDLPRGLDDRQTRGDKAWGNDPTKGPATGVNRTPTYSGRSGQWGHCPRCKSTDHRLANCPEVTCHQCNKKGHIASGCTQPAENVGSRR